MQRKINYLIIGVTALLLIVLGVFYYKGRSLKEPPQGPSLVEAISILENPSDELGTILTPEPEATVPALSAEEIKAKFNTAMDNARTSFRNKDYSQSIVYYKQALTLQNTDTPYSGLFIVYGAQGDWVNAQKVLDLAIKINPLFVDYWISKLTVLDEKTSATYQELKNVYNEGLSKVDPKTKINLVSYFAGIAENNGQITDAITAWTYSKQLFPENSSIYQTEIDRLQTKI